MGSAKIVVNILALCITILLAGTTRPSVVEASFFSWLFGPGDVKAEEVSSTNVQNMALLQAVISPISGESSTESGLSIVEGTSLLPETSGSSSDSKGVKTSDSDQISLYVVHKGDTLPAIAKMFGVSVNTIKWGNDLKSDTISVGQTLVILPISGIQHKVKSGDTLQSIAKLHKGDLDEILQYNNLTSTSKLAIGDVIFIPDGEAVVTASVSSGSGSGSVGSSLPVYSGYYMRPIIGGIKTQGIHGHNGIDLASSYGSNILASADGEVIISKSSGWNGGYGSYIVLKHDNGTQTLYGHLSTTLVSVGDHVSQGQVIGKMGSTGSSTGVHLHFEIRGARNPF